MRDLGVGKVIACDFFILSRFFSHPNGVQCGVAVFMVVCLLFLPTP